jgi:hypothetical protein
LGWFWTAAFEDNSLMFFHGQFFLIPFFLKYNCVCTKKLHNINRAAMGGKAAKAWSLAGFWEIETRGGSAWQKMIV